MTTVDRTQQELNANYIRFRKENPKLEPFACWCKMADEVYDLADDPVVVRDAWLMFVEQRNKTFKKENKVYKKRKKKS